MKRKTTGCIAVMAALPWAVAGCQSTLDVKVELLAPEPGGAGEQARLTQDVSHRYLQELQITMGQLTETLDRIHEAKEVLRGSPVYATVVDQPSGQFKNINEFELLLNDYKDSFKELAADVTAPASPITLADYNALRVLQHKLAAAIQLYQGGLNALEDDLRKHFAAELKERDSDAKKVVTMFDSIGALKLAVESKAGFGGFRVMGVHQIHASDPALADVLKHYKSCGVFSQARATAQGDSTLVFVQESPTYIRFFEMDNNPTVLIQNVLFIVDKVMQAAMKYASPM